MSKEIARRDFLKAAAAGAAGLVAAGTLGGVTAFAEEEKETGLPFEGKKKFAGIGSCRMVTDDIVYIGVSDRRIQLFENVYPIPRGVAYNSYVILDEKTVLVDTVDRSVTGQFFENLTAVLDGRDLDYLIVNHMEPDHSSAISEVLVRYPNAKVVCTLTASLILNQFFACDISDRSILVGEGDTLNVGKHTLAFVTAPMVHWPEVMMTYDTVSGALFSADAFGSFGALNGNLFADEVDFEKDWLPDARRYYCNIVGKYGKQVQDVLAKAGTVDIKILCPTHGPVWRENLGWIIEKYSLWSSYTPEEKAVMVVYGSVYGGTESAANSLAAPQRRRRRRGLRRVQDPCQRTDRRGLPLQPHRPGLHHLQHGHLHPDEELPAGPRGAQSAEPLLRPRGERQLVPGGRQADEGNHRPAARLQRGWGDGYHHVQSRQR